MLPKGLHRVLAVCWTSKSTERIMPKPPFSEDCATKPTRKRNGDEGYREQIRHSLRRKSRKNALFRSQICTFASDNSERSLAIQNNVPQSTSLISKSLPIYSPLNGNTLLLSKIVRKQKIHPGFFLKKEMKFRGITAAKLAKQIGVKTVEITAIFNEEADITAEMAKLIEAATGISGDFILRIQNSFNAWQASENKELQKRVIAIRKACTATTSRTTVR